MTRPAGGPTGGRLRTADPRPGPDQALRSDRPARWWLIWAGLAALALVFCVPHLHQLTGAWGYTQTGTDLLLAGGPEGGLHLYTHHPELQMGPLTFGAGLLVRALPRVLRPGALWVAMTAAGLLLVRALAGAARPPVPQVPALPAAPAGRPGRATVAIGGAAVVASWSVLAIPGGHLDDVLALAFAVAALRARLSHRLVLTGCLLAGAVDAKPWALAFLALAVDPARPLRAHLRAFAALAGLVAVAWLPFLLADRDLRALERFTIPDAADSALRVLGYTGAVTPGWDRPAQVAGAIVVGLVAVLRNRPGGVLLAGLALRILLDPGTHTYYTAGLLLAALAFDLTTTRWALPWTTIAGFVTVLLPHLVLSELGAAHDRGLLRAAFTVGAVLVVVAAPASLLRRSGSGSGRSSRPPPDLSGGTRGRS